MSVLRVMSWRVASTCVSSDPIWIAAAATLVLRVIVAAII
jgi:hypothetical protein